MAAGTWPEKGRKNTKSDAVKQWYTAFQGD